MKSPLRHDFSPAASAVHPSVEDLVGAIAELVLERQRLRAAGVIGEDLECNRAALVTAHWQLSHALIQRYCPPKPNAASAAA